MNGLGNLMVNLLQSGFWHYILVLQGWNGSCMSGSIIKDGNHFWDNGGKGDGGHIYLFLGV